MTRLVAKWTPIRHVLRNNEIGVCAQNMLIVLYFIVNRFGITYVIT